VRGICPDQEDDPVILAAWQDSQAWNRVLRSFGTRGIRYVEQLTTRAGHWLKHASIFPSGRPGSDCSTMDFDNLLAHLSSKVSLTQRRQWAEAWTHSGSRPADCLHADIRTALHSAPLPPLPSPSTEDSDPTSPVPEGPPSHPDDAAQRYALPLMLDGTVVGRTPAGEYHLRSHRLPQDLFDLRTSDVPDLQLAELLTQRRAVFSLPLGWMYSSANHPVVRVECVLHQGAETASRDHGSILLYAPDSHEFAWMRMRGIRSVRTALGNQLLRDCCRQPEWTVPHAVMTARDRTGQPHPALRAWSRTRGAPTDPNAAWTLLTPRPDPLSPYVRPGTEQAHPTDLRQPLLSTVTSQRRVCTAESQLEVHLREASKLLNTDRRINPLITFDFQVGIRQLLAFDDDGWKAWTKNGGVVLEAPADHPLAPAMHPPTKLAASGKEKPAPPLASMLLPQFAGALADLQAPLSPPVRSPREESRRIPHSRGVTPSTHLRTGVLERLAGACLQDRRARYAAPHRWFQAAIIEWSEAQVVWGPTLASRFPGFARCQPAPAEQQETVCPPAPSPQPWVILLDHFLDAHRAAVLEAARQHAAGAVVFSSRMAAAPFAGSALPPAPVHSYPKEARLLEIRGHWTAEPATGTLDKGDRVELPHIFELWRIGSALPLSATLHPGRWCGDWETTQPEPPVPLTPAIQAWRQFEQGAAYNDWGPLWIHAATDGSVQRATAAMGAGAICYDGTTPWTTAVRVPGKLSSLRVEAVALIRLLQHVPSGTSLIVYTDSLALMQSIVSHNRRDFCAPMHSKAERAVIEHLLSLLNARRGAVHIVKVKSHMGMPANGQADALAGQGVLCPLPDEREVAATDDPDDDNEEDEEEWMEQQEVAPWTVHWRDSPPGGKPCMPAVDRKAIKVIVKQAVLARTTLLQLSTNTMFIRFIRRPEAKTAISLSHRLSAPQLRVWFQVVAGMYPTQSYLHRIGKATSPACLWPPCGGRPETTGHVFCSCPQLHGACTQAHNTVLEGLAKAISELLTERHMTPTRRFWDLPLHRTGLRLRPVLRPDTTWPGAQRLWTPGRIGRLKPDGVIIDDVNRTITILELSRPSDSFVDVVYLSAHRKSVKYSLILDALSEYRREGWTISFHPLIIGIRGSLINDDWDAALQAIRIPQPQSHNRIRATVAKLSMAELHTVHLCRHKRRQYALPTRQFQRCRDQALATIPAFPPSISTAA